MWMFLWTLKTKIMNKVVFKITAALSALLVQVYSPDVKVAIDSSKIEISCPVSDSVHSKHQFKTIISNNKKNQPS